MNPAELDTLGVEAGCRIPLRLHGWQRGFVQRPAWRQGPVGRTAVLGVARDPHAWINAVAFRLEDDTARATLATRERGYDPAPVAAAAVEPYGGGRVSVPGPLWLHVPLPGRQISGELPNPAYLRECLDGAAAWGGRFFFDFCATTAVSGHADLAAYLKAVGGA